MREIKFRAWDGELKEMFHVVDLHMREPGVYAAYVLIGGVEVYRGEMTSVMQYTGLKDKDGKEIYEGDVLRDVDGGSWDDIVVEYGFQEVDAFIGIGFNLWPFKATPDYKGKYEEENSALRRYEVIGNIYENPELLTSQA